jgi:hypothetical protein
MITGPALAIGIAFSFLFFGAGEVKKGSIFVAKQTSCLVRTLHKCKPVAKP